MRYQEAVVQHRGKGSLTGQFSKMIYVRHDCFSKNTANVKFITRNAHAANENI